MQVNKYLSSLAKLETPPVGNQPNGGNLTSRQVGNAATAKSGVVLSINSASNIPASPMTISKFLANITKFSSPVQIADTAANIAKNLDTLKNLSAPNLAKIDTIEQQGTAQNIVLTYGQWLDSDAQDVLAKLADGSDIFAVKNVPDQYLSDVQGDAKVLSIGVVGVDKSDLADRLTDMQTSKISTIGVVDVSYTDLTDSGSDYFANLKNRAVTSIGVLDVPSANLATVLANTKVKTATVIDVLAKDALKVGTKTQVTSFEVADTSANLAANFNGLLAKQNKITAVYQGVPAEVMDLTGAQYKVARAAGNLLSKFDTDYTVNLSNVRASDYSTLASDAEVVQIDILDSGVNIARNFDALNAQATFDKINNINQSGSKDLISISASQFVDGADLLDKIQGAYTLAITDATYSQLSSLSLTSNTKIRSVGLVEVAIDDLANAARIPKVKTIQVLDDAATISLAGSLSAIKTNLAKISQIGNINDPSGSTRENITFTPTNYDAKIVDKLSGFGTVVDYSGHDASEYRITSDSKGLRTITLISTGAKKVYANNVNFFQFDDKNLFGTTGNKNVDAILLAGTDNWWRDADATATSNAQITGVMNSLADESSVHELTFSFLSSSSDIDNASPAYKDQNGFVEMSDSQKDAVKKALDYISTLTNLTFTEALNPGEGDLNFGTNDQGTASGAYAYSPNSGAQVNVMLNNHAGSIATTNSVFTQGSYGWETLIHEIAHAVGLKHPGNYNAGGGGTVGPYLPSGDAGSRRYTIMSYNNSADSQNVDVTQSGGSTTYTSQGLNPDTFMIYDIAALQFLYGVNTTAQGSQNLQGLYQSERASVVFQPMVPGQTLSIAGLTFTAGANGATAAQVATAFGGITDAITADQLNTLHALDDDHGGTFTSGPASGWTSGAASNSSVVFLSTNTDPNIDATDLSGVQVPVEPDITITTAGDDSHTEVTDVSFVSMVPGQTLSIAGLTFTAGANGATAAQVATAFGGITDAITADQLNTLHALDDDHGGTFTSGPASGWTSDSAVDNLVTFTSTAINSVVNDSLSSDSSLVSLSITTTPGEIPVDQVEVAAFQTTTFTSGWRGFESLYIPEAQTGEILDLSDIDNKNIVDLRAGAFSSINVLPPNTKTDLPTSMLRSFQTYFGYNNVAMAYGSEINAVKGGSGADTYYVSDKNVTIMDSGGINRVYLDGQAADWDIAEVGDVATYTNIATEQKVELVGSGFQVSYYDAAKEALTHGPLDLQA